MQKFTYYVGLTSTKLDSNPSEMKQKLCTILDTKFNSYTLLDASGVWKGEHEPCAVCIIMDDCGQLYAQDVATEIKTGLKQDAVLLTVENINAILI